MVTLNNKQKDDYYASNFKKNKCLKREKKKKMFNT